MTKEYDNSNRVVIFNSGLEGKAPTHTGKVVLGKDLVRLVKEGKRDFEIALWKRESEKGVKYLSGVIKEPYQKEFEEEEDEDAF